MAEELTLEQQKALALATARKRAAESVQEPSALSEFGHGLGLVARAGVNAVAGLPAMAADAVTGVANQFLPEGSRFQAQMPALNALMTKWGIAQPRDAAERILSDMLASTGGVAATSKLAGYAGGALAPLAQNVGTQLTSATLGSGASSATREAGGGPGLQFAAGLGGSLLPMMTQLALRGIAPNFTQRGREDQMGRLLNEASGNQKQAVLNALDKNTSLVPGERPTTGQAASDVNAPALAAVEKQIVSKYRPDLAMERTAENQGARLAAVQSVGKDEAALNAATASRTALANQEYGAAKQVPVRGDPALAKLLQDPFIKKEIPDAIDLMKGRPAKDNLTEFLQNVKIGLDQKLSKTGNDALSSAQEKAALEAKANILLWLDAKNPQYASARANFAQRSEPINQMQIGQYLEQKLSSPLATERPSVFAQAMRDAPGTIEKSAGIQYNNLSDVLNPKQVGLLGGVQSSLEREALANRQATAGSQKAAGLLGSAFEPVSTPPLLLRAVTATRFVLEKIGIATKNKTLEELAAKIQDPTISARLMREATPNQIAAMKEVIKATTLPTMSGLFQTEAQK